MLGPRTLDSSTLDRTLDPRLLTLDARMLGPRTLDSSTLDRTLDPRPSTLDTPGAYPIPD
jgi:hypothetical protein